MRIIIFIALIVAFIVVTLSLALKEPKKKNTVKCSCGHEFKYKQKDIITYKFSGRLHKEVECPRCKTYINIDS